MREDVEAAQLIDGTEVSGFLFEAIATEGARDITELGSWSAYANLPAKWRGSSTAAWVISHLTAVPSSP